MYTPAVKRLRVPGAASAIAALVLGAVVAATSAASAGAPSFGWKITGDRGTVYLVGSVHMLTRDYYPLSPALEAAFDDSDLLVEEVDFADVLAPESQMQMLTRGMLPGGQSLDAVVSAETFGAVSRRLSELGLPIEPLRRFKPWALALTLLGLEWQQTGFDPDLGIDRHFYNRARAAGIPVRGLETLDFQISRFDGLSREEQDRLLASSVRDPDIRQRLLADLIDAWRAGDPAALERIVLADLKQEPRLYDRLLVERNRMWLPAIDALLTGGGTTMVVVGAAHLVGPDGLLVLLR
jgi:uncharacterized protein YbaP (TraB family)